MSLRKPAYTAAEVAAAADAIRANTAILETAYADAAAEFTLWDSTAPGFLVDQGLKRLKCPSESQFFPGAPGGPPNVDWLMANAVPNMVGYNPLSIDVEVYGKKATPTEPPYTPQDIEYLRTIVGCFHKGNPGQKIGVYMTPPERYGGCATVGPGTVFDQRWAAWTQRNAVMKPLADDVDLLMPSLYGLYSEMPTWVKFAQQNVLQTRMLSGNKPVIAYLWPIWHSNSNKAGQPISYDDWMTMLETLFPICDGIAIWMASTDRFDPNADYWKATEAFMKRHGLMGR